MASKATNTVVMWAGLAFGVLFILPRLVAAFAASAAQRKTQFSPGAAAEFQASRAINTAGALGNSALSSLLSNLLRPQSQQNAARGSSGGMGATSGAAIPRFSADSRDRDDMTRFLDAGGITPLSEVTGRGDYLRTPSPIQMEPWQRVTVPAAPALDYTQMPQSVGELDFLGLSSDYALASPDLYEFMNGGGGESYYFDNFDSLFYMPDVSLSADSQVYDLWGSGDYYQNPYESFGMVEPVYYGGDGGGGEYFESSDGWY